MFDAPQPRRFAVQGVTELASRAQLVEDASFLEAALQYLEDHCPASGEEVALDVEDCETGERQGFRIDLDTGVASVLEAPARAA